MMTLLSEYNSDSDSNSTSEVFELPQALHNLNHAKEDHLEPAAEGDQIRMFGIETRSQSYDSAMSLLEKNKKRVDIISSKKVARELKRRRLKRRLQDEENLDLAGPWTKYSSESSTDSEEVVDMASEADLKVYDKENGNIGNIDSEIQENSSEEEETQTTEFFGEDLYDYQGRTYMHIPNDVGHNLKKDPMTIQSFPPKKVSHRFLAHKRGVNKLELFPNSGHLLLSCGNDSIIKLWDVYHRFKLLRTFTAHSLAVKDIKFNSTGEVFYSCSYDKRLIIWNVERGEILGTLKFNAVPNVILLNPNNEDEILVGLSNNEIQHYDLSNPKVHTLVQTYSHHLAAINSLEAVDNNKRFASTSDDKSIRIWDWNVNIPIKAISDPSQSSIPTSKLHPSGEFLALQSMDNRILVLQAKNKFKFSKKTFKGHEVVGYGVGIDISLDGKIIYSGDQRGFLYYWEWKSGKILGKLKVGTMPLICVKKHPQESKRVVIAGLDGFIYCCD